MTPTAPASTPLTANSNQPFGGFGQAQSDYGSVSNILNYLPTQEAQTTSAATSANNNPGSILPNISINAPTYTAPTPTIINPSNYGTDLSGYNTAVQQAEGSLTSQENSIYGGALGALNTAEQQYGNLTPVYQKLASEYNIPGYQNDVSTLSGLLQNLNRDVNAQTTLGGGLMTNSARDEMYQNEAQPINTALTTAGEFLNYGQQDVSNLLDTYQKSLTNALTPLQTNISNLPTMFGQTNQAAQAGYEQGGTTLENLISNAQRQQEIATAQEQANTYARMVQAEYGSGAGGMSSVIGNLGGNKTGQLLPGISFKNPATSGKGGYNFVINNNPASAATWAINNASLFGQGTSPAQAVTNMIYSMAANGDQTANQAYTEISNNKGNITPDIMNKYASLFWGSPGFSGQTSTPAPTAAPKGNNNNNPGILNYLGLGSAKLY